MEQLTQFTRFRSFLLVILVIGLVGTGFAFVRPSSNQTSPQPSSLSYTTPGAIAGFQRSPYHLTLYTVATAEKILGHSLAIPPDPSTASPGLRVLGVDLQRLPTSISYDNGSHSFLYSLAVVYLWDGRFVNGTTTDQEIMGSGGITIMESTFAADPRFNATLAEESLVNQGHFATVTQTITSNGQETRVESTITRNSQWWSYIAYVNGEPVVVSPGQHGVTWPDTTKHMWITVVGPSLQTDQLIQLASSMLP